MTDVPPSRWGRFLTPLYELQFERLLSDDAFGSCNPGLVLMERVGGPKFVVEGARVVFEPEG